MCVPILTVFIKHKGYHPQVVVDLWDLHNGKIIFIDMKISITFHLYLVSICMLSVRYLVFVLLRCFHSSVTETAVNIHEVFSILPVFFWKVVDQLWVKVKVCPLCFRKYSRNRKNNLVLRLHVQNFQIKLWSCVSYLFRTVNLTQVLQLYVMCELFYVFLFVLFRSMAPDQRHCCH